MKLLQVENPLVQAVNKLNKCTLRPLTQERAFDYANRAEKAGLLSFNEAWSIRGEIPSYQWVEPETAIFIGCAVHGWLDDRQFAVWSRHLNDWSYRKLGEAMKS